MIISASRRTDISAFYAEWIVSRLKEGYCTVANPYNRDQMTRISLKPEDVDVIVFWTRNPRPLMPYLAELDSRGYRYYFQFTILGYPREIDPKSPPAVTAVKTLCELAERLGPKRVISALRPNCLHGADVHGVPPGELPAARRVAQRECSTSRREHRGHVPQDREETEEAGGDTGGSAPLLQRRLRGIAAQAGRSGEEERHGDRQLCRGIGSPTVRHQAGQVRGRPGNRRCLRYRGSEDERSDSRNACGCVVSRDIGMYESCLFGCQYCYATKSFEQAKLNFDAHDPESPSMLGWHEAAEC